MTTSKEFQVTFATVLGVIIVGAVLIEIFGLFFYYETMIKPAFIPIHTDTRAASAFCTCHCDLFDYWPGKALTGI